MLEEQNLHKQRKAYIEQETRITQEKNLWRIRTLYLAKEYGALIPTAEIFEGKSKQIRQNVTTKMLGPHL